MGLLTMLVDTNGLILLFVAFVAFYVYMTRNFDHWRKRHVKEISPWPFFGNFAACLLMRKNVHEYFQDVYKAGKGEQLFGFYVLDEPQLMVRDPELIKHVLVKDFQDFPNRPLASADGDVLGNANLFLVREPIWRVTRQTMSKFFTSGKMKKVFERMPDIAADLDRYLVKQGLQDEGSIINVTELCSRFGTDLMGTTTFGMKFNALNDEKSEFYAHGKNIFRGTYWRHFQYLSVFIIQRFLKLGFKFFDHDTTKFLKTTFINTLNEKAKQKNRLVDFFDLLTDVKNGEVLINKQIPYKFTDEELVSQTAVFFSAGFGTTAVTVISSLYELAKYPDIQKKLRHELHDAMKETDGKLTYDMIASLPFLDAVVSEVLRMYPILSFLNRVSEKEYQFPGTNVTIEKNTTVIIPLMALQMDPQYFPNPESFQPERFSSENKKNYHRFTYFPFGDGPHICIGQRLGLMVSKFGVSYLISRYEFELCEETDPMELNTFSVFVKSKSDVKLKMKKVF